MTPPKENKVYITVAVDRKLLAGFIEQAVEDGVEVPPTEQMQAEGLLVAAESVCRMIMLPRLMNITDPEELVKTPLYEVLFKSQQN